MIRRIYFSTSRSSYEHTEPPKLISNPVTRALKSIGDLCKCLHQSENPPYGAPVPTRSTSVEPDRRQANFNEFSERLKNLRNLIDEQEENHKRMEREWKDGPRLNSSVIVGLSKYLDCNTEYFVLFGFLTSLLMVLLVWCLLTLCCRKPSRPSTSELFASSTPLNAYSPINSTIPSNISPIAMHEDQARAALLEGSMYSMDTPSYNDIKPPSYDDAVKNLA